MALPWAKAQAQNFTIIALPDTQYYAQDYPATLTAQTQWIVNNASALNIKAVVGLGDVVNGGGVGSEWTAADNSIDLLEAKIPYFITIGNHDYNKNDPPNRTSSATNFNNHFGPSRYNNSYSGYGGSYTSGSNENWWGSVTINGEQYIFIQLEFYPRMAVLQWASGVIRSHPSAEVIITTHGYEYNDNNRVALCNQYNAEYYNMGADNDGDEMWVNLASQFPNVSLVLSGHIINGSKPSAGHQTEPGFNGNIVNEVMADYQNLANGGNGYLRIMTFQPANNQIVVQTYSPTLGSYLTDAANSFTIPWHQTATSGTGTISGRLKNSACSAVSGAIVSYAGGSTSTDSNGKFTLTGVPSGVQTVSVQAAGYPTITKQVPVAPGRTSNPLFFVSTSTGTVTGTLTDVRSGAAIAGATVNSSGSSTTTNSSGQYTLSRVAAVSAQLTASASGYSNLTQQISVTSGATSTLNFALASTAAATTGSIAGNVTNSTTGAAIVGATVLYSGGSGITDSNGNYTLSGVAQGAVSLTASASGMQSATAGVSVTGGATTTKDFTLSPIPTGSASGTVTDGYTNLPMAAATVSYSGGNTATDVNGNYALTSVPTGTQTITAAAAGYQTQSKSISVSQNASSTANFVLQASAVGTIAGTVTDASSGTPILGASLTYRGGNALTNATGGYSLANAPAGTATLSASAGGYVSQNLSVSVSTNQTTAENLQLVPIPTYGNITGVVTNAANKAPLAGAAVSAGGIAASTASDGSYTLANVPSGPQTLIVHLTGFQQASQSVSVSANQTATANVALVSQTGTINGTVKDSITAIGLAGAAVSYAGGSTTTDANGNYSLSNVTVGTQTVTATLALYQVGSQSVNVTSGKTSTANFALVLVPTSGTVAGVVSDSSTKLPISGATVSYGNSSTTTDVNGAYTFAGIPAGTQSFSATAANYSASNQSVTVVAGGSVTQNFSLDAIQSTGTTGGSGSVSGTVVDAQTNTPLAGVTITTANGTATTDANGAYSISGLPAGSESISASSSGYAVFSATISVTQNSVTTENFALTALSNTGSVTGVISDANSNIPLANVSVTYSGGSATTDASGAFALTNVPAGAQNLLASLSGYDSASLTVTVLSQQAVTQNFVLTQIPTTGSISGTVSDSATGGPLANATVAYAGGSAISASDGTFALPSVPTGSQALTVSLAGYTSSAASVSVTAGQNSTQNFALALAPTTGSITGHVTDSLTDKALPSATVTYQGGSTTTDSSGAYTLSNLAPGSQTLTVTLLGYNNGSGTVTVAAAGSVTQDFALVALPTTGTVIGTVVDTTTHAVLAGASVSLGSLTATTDSSGSYTLPNVPTGSQSLTAAISGYNTSTATAMISAGQTTTTNFTLAQVATTGTVTGRVTDASTSTAISGATVSYPGGSTTTDSSGSFTLNNVPAGANSLSVSATGYNSTSSSMTVTAGSTTTQNFALNAAPQVGAISGKVTNASGGALSGVTVGYAGGSAVTDANGNYTLAKVASGSQTVTASLAGYTSVSRSVTVTTNQTTIQNFTLTASTGTITGKITNAANGAAISGATISVAGKTVTSNSSGVYTVTAVPTGSYTLTVKRSGWTTRTSKANVVGGTSTTVNVALATTGIVTGTIKTAAGSVDPGVTVTLKGGVIATTKIVMTNTSGVYKTGWIPTGTYTVTISQSGHTTKSGTAVVSSGKTTTLNFTGF